MPIVLYLMLGNIEPLPEKSPEPIETDSFVFVDTPKFYNFLDCLLGSDLVIKSSLFWD